MQLAYQVGEYKTATETAVELVDKMGSKNVEDHLLLGMLYDIQNEPEKARPRLQAAMDLSPTEPAPYLAMVSLLARQARKAEESGDAAAAAALRADADKAIADASKYVPEANRIQVLAQCLDHLGRQGEALTMFTEALAGRAETIRYCSRPLPASTCGTADYGAWQRRSWTVSCAANSRRRSVPYRGPAESWPAKVGPRTGRLA